MIKGVKINCQGDMELSNKPRFEAVEVSPTHLIFSVHDTSDIADRIGLPIFTWRCPPDPEWENDLNGNPFDNQDAAYLHLCCKPEVERDFTSGILGWGFAPMAWQNNVGSAIVVRQDKKPLFPFHVEALCNYCRRDASNPQLLHRRV